VLLLLLLLVVVVCIYCKHQCWDINTYLLFHLLAYTYLVVVVVVVGKMKMFNQPTNQHPTRLPILKKNPQPLTLTRTLTRNELPMTTSRVVL